MNEVVGVGGLGKTALVLEVAYLCKKAKEEGLEQLNGLNIPIFDAIIFSSAKTKKLESRGIVEISSEARDKCLQDIFRTIAATLDTPIINQATASNQLSQVYKCLDNQQTLLIIDNMETLERSEKERVYEFLGDVPPTTQVVITTREKIGYLSITLDELSKEDSLELIKQEASLKNINISFTEATKLYKRFKGIPLALKYTIGKKASGRSVNFDAPLDDNIAQFCFEDSLSSIRGNYSYKLLMALAIFPGDPLKDFLVEVAGLSSIDPDKISKELDELKVLNLVSEYDGRYHLLTMTKEYTRIEIGKNQEFEDIARERLVNRYILFTQKHGGLDWEEWYEDSKQIRNELENIKGILDWCAVKNRYEDVKAIWKNISNYIDLLGDWQLCLYWTDWLIQKSIKRSELDTYISLLASKAWIQILMGGETIHDARNLLMTAWKLKSHSSDLTKTELAKNLAFLDLNHKHHYRQSIRWLNHAEGFLKLTKLAKKEYKRYEILFAYYRGRVEYFQKNFEIAKEHFEQVIKLGEEIKWQRYSNYAKHRLGDVALELGHLEIARQLLETAYIIAKNNSEPRRVFLCLISKAKLEKKSGNLEKACKLEAEAKLLKANNPVSTRDEEDFKLLHDDLACDFRQFETV